MFAYKTNSPDYLDYVASAMTREEILADPKFCVLLENPYIKDNMEVALAWRKAKFGDYQDKYEFVEYYLCNGPELDADTLLHYRALAKADPVVMEIANSYFKNSEVLSEIREEKFGKKKKGDWTDCFTNPCFYLGDFSAVMGSMGDIKNVETYFNTIAERFAAAWGSDKKKKSREEVERKTGLKNGSATTTSTETSGKTDNNSSSGSSSNSGSGDSKNTKNTKNTSSTPAKDGAITPQGDSQSISSESNSTGQSAGSDAHAGKLRPAYFTGWAKLGKAIFENDTAFANDLLKVSTYFHVPKFGDWSAKAFTEAISLAEQANVVRMMGDCYRMWQQVRRLRVFGPDNQYGPITSDQLVGGKNTDGTPLNPVTNPSPTPEQSTAAIDSKTTEAARREIAAKNGGKTGETPAQESPKEETDPFMAAMASDTSSSDTGVTYGQATGRHDGGSTVVAAVGGGHESGSSSSGGSALSLQQQQAYAPSIQDT